MTRTLSDADMIAEAARAIIMADTYEDLDTACKEMVEVLLYAKSIEWWEQFK